MRSSSRCACALHVLVVLLLLFAGWIAGSAVRHHQSQNGHLKSTSAGVEFSGHSAGHRSAALASREPASVSTAYFRNHAEFVNDGDNQQVVVEQLLDDDEVDTKDKVSHTKYRKSSHDVTVSLHDVTTSKPPTGGAIAGFEVTPRSRMPYGLSKGLLEIRKANEHYLKVHTEARCKNPRPRVIRVKEFYPDPSKDYLPSCTVLHRCGDETGCCESESMQCVAKRQNVVELHFYKLHLSSQQGGGVGLSGSDTVEKLAFVNDTECECQLADERPRFHARKTACLQCPTGFTLREQSQPGACACDCFDKQKSCLKMKRGREALSEVDRRCVEARRCHPPDCEYGVYDTSVGRCPRKSDRRNATHATASSNHHWWRFDERD